MSADIKKDLDDQKSSAVSTQQEAEPSDNSKALTVVDRFEEELNPLDELEPTAADVKTSDGSTRTIGFMIILVVFVLLGGWSALAPIDSAALAAGTVKVEHNRKTVQHLEGGIVSALNVSDGDKVNKGDVLLVIDQTQAKADLGITYGQLVVMQAMQARLIAERDNLDAIAFNFENPNDPRIAKIMQSEIELFQARKQSLNSEVGVLEQRTSQLQNQVKGLKALIDSKGRLLSSYAEEINDNKALLAEGFVSKQRLRDVQRSRDSLQGEVAEHRTNISSVEVQLTETQLKILQVQQNFRTDVVNRLTEAQSKVFDLEERIAAISDKVKRTEVLAPSSGMVLGLNIHTVGGVLSPGTPILDIVPEGEALIVEAEVSVTDIDRISLDMAADIRFSAFKSGTTPVIDGKVVNISADSLVNEATGASFYLAQVVVTPEGMEKLGELQLLPGMPAEVLINTGSRTLLEYLLQPATDAFARSMIED